MSKTDQTLYRKHFVPLESNPTVFNALMHSLGVSPAVEFHDVLSLDDPDLLAFIPRPAFALVLVFPTSDTYEAHKRDEEAENHDYTHGGEDETVMWYRQTINNACGLYGILHAVSNGLPADLIVPNSHLSDLIKSCKPLNPTDRARTLEDDDALEKLYKIAALDGDTEAPENAEDEVDFHYVCFAKSHKDGHLYELDGDRKGPVDKGPCPDDILGERGIQLVKEFIERENGNDTSFSLLALASA